MRKERKFLLLMGVFLLAVLFSFFLDSYFLELVPSLREPFLNPLFIFLGGFWGLFAYFLFLGVLVAYEKVVYRQESKRIGYLIIGVVLAVGLGIFLSYALKYIIMRGRPGEIVSLVIKTTPAFPSSHALVGFATYFFISKLKSGFSWLAYLFIFLLAFSGYYNGVHYLSDVLGGIFLGLLLSYLIFEFLFKKINFKPSNS